MNEGLTRAQRALAVAADGLRCRTAAAKYGFLRRTATFERASRAGKGYSARGAGVGAWQHVTRRSFGRAGRREVEFSVIAVVRGRLYGLSFVVFVLFND